MQHCDPGRAGARRPVPQTIQRLVVIPCPFDTGLNQALDWLQPSQRAWEEQSQEQWRDSSEGKSGLPGTL